MNRRSLMILGGATAAAVAAAGIASQLRQPDAPPAGTGERLFPDLAQRAGGIATVVLERGGTAFTLRKDGERWVAVERGNYPAVFDRVRELIFDVSQLRTLEPRSANPEQYAAMQVEDPVGEAQSVLVRFRDAQNNDIVGLIVGRARMGRGGDDTVFVRRLGEAQAWLATGRVTIARDPGAWLERALFDIAGERVRRVSLVRPDGARVTVERASREATDFTLQNVPAERRAKGAADLNQVGRAFDRMELDDVRPAASVPFSPAGARAELETFDGLSVTALFAEHEGQTWVRFTAAGVTPPAAPAPPAPPPGLPAPPQATPPTQPAQPAAPAQPPAEAPRDVVAEANDLNARLSPWAYRLPSYRMETLTRTLEDLLEPRS